jgi:hypothetical protein
MALTLLSLVLPYTPPAVPRPGEHVDERFEFALPASVEGPEVRLAVHGREIVIPRELLETLASQAPSSWKTEAERQAVSSGRPARALLQAADSAQGGSLDWKHLDGSAASLVASILQAGRACVYLSGAATPVRRLVAHYVGSSAGPMLGMGEISIELLESRRPLFSFSWFVQ